MLPSGTEQEEQIAGLVERVTFHSDQTGFAVLRLKARGRRELVTLVGEVPSIGAGEWVEARGHWVVDTQHGRQFKASFLKTSSPTTLEGIEKYLASGMVRGVGPHFASLLVAAFGMETFSVIENQPRRLREVEGIGPVRQERIVSAWIEQRSVRDILVFLHSHGVGTSRAFRIYKTYGDRAIDLVREDPYRLARDIRGIGFQTADRIAASLGVDPTSDLRARAGVEHLLLETTNSGHCAFPRADLVDRAAEKLDIPLECLERAVDHGLMEKRLKERLGSKGEPLLYLSSLDAAEEGVARTLALLSSRPHPCPPIDLDRAMDWVEKELTLDLAQGQRDALARILQGKVTVLTGGPGVGKTTLVQAVVRIFEKKGLSVVLCTPTGRASRRLAETTGREAKTIHRLLAFDPGRGTFRHDASHPLPGHVFVVDEMSMVDLSLAHQLLRAIPPHGALIMVGDADQLPSVGPGNVLGDIIRSGVVSVCRLDQVFRQAAQSAIVANAHRVNQGQMPHWPKPDRGVGETSDFYFVEAQEPTRAVDLIVHLLRQRIPKRFSFHPLDDVQVLTPMQRGELGARNLNRVLQKALNPGEGGVERFGWTYRCGDKVMQTVNNYDREVFNGDIGRVSSVDLEKSELTVRFPEREVSYAFGDLDEITLSYAVTIHKSQGSEYPCVVVPVHTQHYIMLRRNLLYTALTRGRRLVVLVGKKEAVEIAVKQIDARTRITDLKRRIQQACATPTLLDFGEGAHESTGRTESRTPK
jgi:exodeoxyribonuclease V alpha subunit